MYESFLDDGLNPRYVGYSPVFLDELDPQQRLSPERLAIHIATAVDAFHAGQDSPLHSGDELEVVRDLHIEHLNPVRGTGALRIDVWLDELNPTDCVYGFLCSSEDGLTAYARGERTIVRFDPKLRRPARWSDRFMQKHSALLKTLHAYA